MSRLSILSRKFQHVLLTKRGHMAIAKVFHADHGVSNEMLQWAVDEIKPTGFFLKTLTLPDQFPDLMNALYGPSSGDEPVSDSAIHMKKRTEDRPESRMVKLPKRATRLLTVIGMAGEDGVTIFTAYGGPAAEREPNDPTLKSDEEKAAASSFWAGHALADE